MWKVKQIKSLKRTKRRSLLPRNSNKILKVLTIKKWQSIIKPKCNENTETFAFGIDWVTGTSFILPSEITATTTIFDTGNQRTKGSDH